MINTDKVKTVHIDKFDIDVKCYLGYDEIQSIIETTLPIDTYNNREKNINGLILHYAAGIPLDVINDTDPDVFLQSGLVDAVSNVVENIDDIYHGISYHTSVQKLLYQITRQMPEINKMIENSPQIKEMMKNGGNK